MLIVSAVAGYTPEQVRPFVLSALQNSSCDLLLLVQTSDRALISWLEGRPRIQLQRVDGLVDPREMAMQRFFVARRLLAQRRVEQVLLLDSRDLIVQQQPELAAGLMVAEEPIRIGDCPHNSAWIQACFGADVASALASAPVLCAGTIAGPMPVVQVFLDRFCQLMDQTLTRLGGFRWGIDQAALNQLLADPSAAGLAPLERVRNTDGRWLTLNHVEHLHLDRQGRLLNAEQRPVDLIHQYDRHPWLQAHLERQLMR